MIRSRRNFLKILAAASLSPVSPALGKSSEYIVNDAHSQLNETRVASIQVLRKRQDAIRAVKKAQKQGFKLAVCGERHAGGGQQFASDGILLDTRGLNQIIAFDREKGLLEVEPGIRWPELLTWLTTAQAADKNPWGVLQKQTGNDGLTVGGAVCANAHGQGLKLKPMVQDIDSVKMVMADGSIANCSRRENPELFKLLLGGYGLFGLIVSVTIRLVRKSKYKRVVTPMKVQDIPAAYHAAVSRKCDYADWQCNIDDSSPDYMQSGLFSYYDKMDSSEALSPLDMFTREQWVNLACLAHKDKTKAYNHFSQHLLELSGKVQWPEVWQSSQYALHYHKIIDEQSHSRYPGSEVLTELYVPVDALPNFMADMRQDFQNNNVNLIYSTVRFIDTDNETFLPWARTPSACVIFNLHLSHDEKSIANCRGHLERLIDHAIIYKGRYYLTYHRFARKDQVLACYPEFPEFLKMKLKYDPNLLFYSDWYKHYASMFS